MVRNGDGADDLDELDEEFVERMNEVLEQRHDTHQWEPKRQNNWRQLLSNACKNMWLVFGVFNQVDLFGGRQEDPDNVHYNYWRHHENYDRRFTRDRCKWWPYISLPLYVLSSIRLTINMCYQYYYDYHYVRQQVFLGLIGQPGPYDSNFLIKSHHDSAFVRAVVASRDCSTESAGEGVATNLTQPPPPATTSTSNTTSSNSSSSSNRLSERSYHHNHQHHHQLQHDSSPHSASTFACSDVMDLNEMANMLGARVAEARAILMRLGSPYIMLTYDVEIVYVFLVSASFVLVIMLRLYYRYSAPFNYPLVRAFLDYKNERRLFNRLIMHELNRFILSSGNFTLACVEQSKLFANAQFFNSTNNSNNNNNQTSSNKNSSSSGSGSTTSTLKRPRRSNSGSAMMKGEFEMVAYARAEGNRFLLDHALTKKQLQHMALNGQLLPAHRTAQWVDQLSCRVIAFSIVAMVYIFLGAIFFAFVFFVIYSKIYIQAYSPLDVLVIAEAGVLVILVVPYGVFNIAILAATCIDQIYYSTDVCSIIHDCIRVNQRRFRHVIATRERQRGELAALLMVGGLQQQQLEGEDTTRKAPFSGGDGGGGVTIVGADKNTARRRKRDGSTTSANFNLHYHQSWASLNYNQLIDDSRRVLDTVSKRNGNPAATTQTGAGSTGADEGPEHYALIMQRAVGGGGGGGCGPGGPLYHNRNAQRRRTIVIPTPRLRQSLMRIEDAEGCSMIGGDGDLGPVGGHLFQSMSQSTQSLLHLPSAVSSSVQSLDQSLSIESCYTQMNADLLRAFIVYKIFVAQMRQTTRAFVTFTLACITLIIVSPLHIRIHAPYLDRAIKLWAVGFSLLTTTAVDFCLILMCYMFARCTEIYRCLSSLLAHAIEVMNYTHDIDVWIQQQQQHRAEVATIGRPPTVGSGEENQNQNQNQNQKKQQQQHNRQLGQHQQQQQIYDSHTIWLLRKELNFPERVVSQFAIVAFDFRLTYSNLLKLHFWVGLLSISILVDGSSSQEFFGRLFRDPFRVFDWP